MYTIYNRIDVHIGLLKQGQKRISDSKQASMCIAHRSMHNAKYALVQNKSFESEIFCNNFIALIAEEIKEAVPTDAIAAGGTPGRSEGLRR
jgi:hypothetical protein